MDLLYLPSIGYPAYAGIDLMDVFDGLDVIRLPRIRGDRPGIPLLPRSSGKATPLCGSTISSTLSITFLWLPRIRGIDPTNHITLVPAGRLPRIRGDRPLVSYLKYFMPQATPHTRGSTYACPRPGSVSGGYPAYAGIDLGK